MKARDHRPSHLTFPSRVFARIAEAASLAVAIFVAATLVAATLVACGPRQAVVETDPRSGEATRDRLEALARTDLDRLRRAQGVHFAEEGTYTYELVALTFEPSAGIDVSVLEATRAGFSALAGGGSVECTIFVGDATPPRSYSTTAGVAECRPRP